MDIDYTYNNSTNLSPIMNKEIFINQTGQQQPVNSELTSSSKDQNTKQNLLKLIHIVDYEKDDGDTYVHDLKAINSNNDNHQAISLSDNDNASISSSLNSKQSQIRSSNSNAKFQSNSPLKTDKQHQSYSNIKEKKKKFISPPPRLRSASPDHPKLIKSQNNTYKQSFKPEKPGVKLRSHDVHQNQHENSISPKFRNTASAAYPLSPKMIPQCDFSLSKDFSSREIHETTEGFKSMTSLSIEKKMSKTPRAIPKSPSNRNQNSDNFSIMQNSGTSMKVFKKPIIEKDLQAKSAKISANSFYQNSRKIPLLQSKSGFRSNESVSQLKKPLNNEISPERQTQTQGEIKNESPKILQKSKASKNRSSPNNAGMKFTSSVLKKDYQISNFEDLRESESLNDELLKNGCQGKVSSLTDLHSEKPNSYLPTEMSQGALKNNSNNLRINERDNTKTLNHIDKDSKPHNSKPPNSTSTKVIENLNIECNIVNRIEQQSILVFLKMRLGFVIKTVSVKALSSLILNSL